jgi:hypothetical protein
MSIKEMELFHGAVLAKFVGCVPNAPSQFAASS